MNSTRPTLLWVNHFLDDARFKAMRFKCLDEGYPKFDFDQKLIDIVGLSEFCKIENNRTPLFIGSQFGISPRINEIPGFFYEDKIIAILKKSLLSGSVSGLSIYRIYKADCKFIQDDYR